MLKHVYVKISMLWCQYPNIEFCNHTGFQFLKPQQTLETVKGLSKENEKK